MILVKNIHAGIFAVFAAVSGFTAIFAGFYMRRAWTRQICESLICLGAFKRMYAARERSTYRSR